MNIERFKESPSGRLVKAGSEKDAYWTFVPDRLPPKLSLTPEFLQRSAKAAYALGELAALGRAMANPHLLLGPFLRREAVLSSRIEGTQADIADLYAYESGQLPLPGILSPPPHDVQEVLNYVHALEHGIRQLPTMPVSLRLIRDLHGILMEGVRGERARPGKFRDVQNYIGRRGATNVQEAEFVPPAPAEMEAALSALERYIHEPGDLYPPLVRLALIHYQFEAIHPFVDGNGRIGRLLISLLTIDWDLLPLPLLYLSAFFERHRDAYYDHLQAVSERGAWLEWVNFFLDGVIEQSQDASGRLKELQDLQMTWRERLNQIGTSASPLRLADHLFMKPIITIPQAEHFLEVSYPTAQRAVEKLVQVNILRQVGESSYDKTYVADEIMSIIMERHQE